MLIMQVTKKLKMSDDDLLSYLYDNIKEYNDFNKLDIISIFLPDTYEVYWNISPKKLGHEMYLNKPPPGTKYPLLIFRRLINLLSLEIFMNNPITNNKNPMIKNIDTVSNLI